MLIEEADSPGHKLLAARVTGTCMWPDIVPGEIVVWDASQLRVQEGEAVAVTADGQLMVKRIYHEPDGTSILVANDGTSVRADTVVILGVVVKVVKERRLERRSRPPGT